MFDKEYFHQQLVRQIEQLGSGRGTLFLHNGIELRVKQIDKACDGYVLLEVYSDEGVNERSKERHRKPGGTDEVFWDRVAVAYESISHVRLSVTGPAEEKTIGFRHEQAH